MGSLPPLGGLPNVLKRSMSTRQFASNDATDCHCPVPVVGSKKRKIAFENSGSQHFIDRASRGAHGDIAQTKQSDK